jgi:hypothetical protein
VRVYFLIIILCIAFKIQGQGVMNTYAYPVFEDMSNTNIKCKHTYDGEVYCMPYMAGLTRLTNTGEEAILALKDKTVRDVQKTQNGMLLAFCAQYIIWLQNDSIIKTFAQEQFHTCVLEPKTNIIYSTAFRNNKSYLYKINNLEITALDSIIGLLFGVGITKNNEIIYTNGDNKKYKFYTLTNGKLVLYDSMNCSTNATAISVKYFYTKDSVQLQQCDEKGIYNAYIGMLHQLKLTETNMINAMNCDGIGLKILEPNKVKII